MTVFGRYLGRAREVVRYEGTASLMWRALVASLLPIGHVRIVTLYRKDLAGPLQPVEAKVAVQVHEAGEQDAEAVAALRARLHGRDTSPVTRPLRSTDDDAELVRSRNVVRERFDLGHRCFVARIDGQIVHYNWLAFERVVFPSWGSNAQSRTVDPRRTIRLKREEAFCYDAYTLERWRGKAIHTKVLREMLSSLQGAAYRVAYTEVNVARKSSWKTHERLGWEVAGTMLCARVRGLGLSAVVSLGTRRPFDTEPGGNRVFRNPRRTTPST